MCVANQINFRCIVDQKKILIRTKQDEFSFTLESKSFDKHKTDYTLNTTISQTKHIRSQIFQTNFFIGFLQESLDLFVCSRPNQFFLISLKGPDQENIQLNWSFNTVLTKY